MWGGGGGVANWKEYYRRRILCDMEIQDFLRLKFDYGACRVIRVNASHGLVVCVCADSKQANVSNCDCDIFSNSTCMYVMKTGEGRVCFYGRVHEREE